MIDINLFMMTLLTFITLSLSVVADETSDVCALYRQGQMNEVEFKFISRTDSNLSESKGRQSKSKLGKIYYEEAFAEPNADFSCKATFDPSEWHKCSTHTFRIDITSGRPIDFRDEAYRIAVSEYTHISLFVDGKTYPTVERRLTELSWRWPFKKRWDI